MNNTRIENDNIHNNVTKYEVIGFSTDFSNVVDKCKSSIVSIRQNDTYSSGFVYGKDEQRVYIVSSFHGVSGSANIEITFHNGLKVIGNLLGKDILSDVALIECEFPYDVQMLSKGDSTLLKDGEFILTIGTAGHPEYAFSSQFGMVSSRYREISNHVHYEDESYDYYPGLIQLSGEFLNGYSGAPVLNMNGELVGMITMKDEYATFATTINEINALVSKLLNDAEFKKFNFGMGGTYLKNLENYEVAGLNIGLDTTDGYYVKEVVNGGLAHNLGINRGDVITSINGSAITDFKSMLNVIYSKAESFDIEVVRNGEKLLLKGEIVND